MFRVFNTLAYYRTHALTPSSDFSTGNLKTLFQDAKIFLSCRRCPPGANHYSQNQLLTFGKGRFMIKSDTLPGYLWWIIKHSYKEMFKEWKKCQAEYLLSVV
jgi:hypothetical protein